MLVTLLTYNRVQLRQRVFNVFVPKIVSLVNRKKYIDLILVFSRVETLSDVVLHIRIQKAMPCHATPNTTPPNWRNWIRPYHAAWKQKSTFTSRLPQPHLRYHSELQIYYKHIW